ncbi:hypothetical protein JY97_00630 [Alkalispirochaeta odontotermitis]|nr:hypothetical protein JY97_00630 [Alkalispirochaeta odontotermitis]
MPAPKGNQFWKARSSHGRKPIFSNAEQLWESCQEYFEWVEANPLYESKAFNTKEGIVQEPLAKMRAMTIGGLCIFLDINQSTWFDYAKNDDFSHVTTRVEEIIRDQKFQGAAADLLNPNIIARDLGLANKQEHTGAGGGPIKTEDVSGVDKLKAYVDGLAKRSGTDSSASE